MRYEVRYRTSCRYRNPVPFAQHLIRLLPANRPGQTIEQSSLAFEPSPAERHEERDFFGNRVAWVAFNTPHATLDTQLEARVDVQRIAPPPEQGSPGWEGVRDAAARWLELAAASPLHFLFASPRVSIFDGARQHALHSFSPGRPVLEAALEFARRIHGDFSYRPGSTDSATDAVTAFAQKRGVCQDFSHVMIAGLRAIGLPAAYVSGFIQTRPPPGRPRLEGADAMHAWTRLWCGPDLGWVDFDPTNAMMVGDAHIEVAVGRDYTDVAPIDGVVIAAGGQSLVVAADVIAL